MSGASRALGGGHDFSRGANPSAQAATTENMAPVYPGDRSGTPSERRAMGLGVAFEVLPSHVEREANLWLQK